MKNKIVTGCLMFLWTAVSAAEQAPPAQRTPTAPTRPAPVPAPAPATPVPAPVTAPPAPVTTPPVPVTEAPAPMNVPLVAPTVPLLPSAFQQTTPPLLNTGTLAPSVRPVDPPLGSELSAKVKEERRRYVETSASAKLEFEARQAEEKKDFDETPRDTGFWETRRLRREFRAAQAKSRLEFNAEQEKKRQTYGWR